MSFQERFERLSHAEKVHLFIGSVAVFFFMSGFIVGILFSCTVEWVL